MTWYTLDSTNAAAGFSLKRKPMTYTYRSINPVHQNINKIKNYGYNSKDLYHMLVMHLQIIDKKLKSRLLTSKSRRYQLWAISKLGVTTSTRKHTGATNVLKEDTSHVSKSSTWPGNKEQSSNMKTIWPKPSFKFLCVWKCVKKLKLSQHLQIQSISSWQQKMDARQQLEQNCPYEWHNSLHIPSGVIQCQHSNFP